MNLAHDAIYGPQAAWFAEQFPIEIRYSGVNMGCQLGTVIGAAIMPTVAALLCVVGRHSSSAATRRRPPLAVADLRLPHAAVPALTHRGTGGEGPRW
ncbi:hypothetical protein BANT10_01198 [Brevibacterium antiquum]|uniref:Uncharacterized protein n=3 Tax=Brevibacterium antiquum TaxID=234835 RepID=A0A2H1JPR6_9MICO|nr:hypothetical protein BANT10_01198 [Brevibacterium antiquum]SMX89469.1 hypothetical protein BANT918_01760 [Brevibacterium antiquum CNRZ 918]